MAIKPLIKTKAHGLENVFYLVPVNSLSPENSMWQVRLIHNHYCVIAVSSKEKALECLYNMVQKYKTYDALEEASDNTLDYPMSPEEKERVVALYRECASDYKEEVNDTVKRAMKDYNKTLLASTPGLPKKKVQPLKKTTSTTSTPPKKKKDKTTKPLTPKVKVTPKKRPMVRLAK